MKLSVTIYFLSRLTAMLAVFEECVKQYMWRALKEKRLPVSFKRIGRWWGNNPKERCEEEIDFIAFSGKKAIFGECKWRNENISEDILDALIKKAIVFHNFTDVTYMLFSKSEFNVELKKREKRQNNISLISIDDMFI